MNRPASVALCPLLLTLLLLGCRPQETAVPEAAPSGPVWLEDISDRVGLDFVHDAGPVGDYFLPQLMGAGAALFDFDQDGLLDIYLLQNGGPKGERSRLYRQMPGGKFQDVSSGSGLDIAGYNMGVAVGDVNNDGRPDVLVTQLDGVKLFLNRGKGTFSDVTEQSGLHNPSWGTSAAFLDYDRDGRLDLVVVNYVNYDPTWPCTEGHEGRRDFCGPQVFKGRVSRLFHNLGAQGAGKEKAALDVPRFQDVTEKSGLGRLSAPGLGVVCADFTGDGWVDILVANDEEANRLWVNGHDGTFAEEGVQRGLAYNGMGQVQAGMGIALGDVDGDGLLDVVISHLPREGNTLWRQGPPGQYQDRSAEAGLGKPHWRGTGFGDLLADLDHDGALDLLVVNGGILVRGNVSDDSLGPFWSAYGERNQVFRNQGGGQFEDISPQNGPFCGAINMGRGLVRGDIDGDGAQDVLVTTVAGRARLFRNIAPKKGHWLQIRAFDPDLKRDALGAEVRVRAGKRTWVCWLHPAESYLCSSEPCAHFGLGPVEHVDGIDILWPDGKREAFAGGAVDRRVKLIRGQGSLVTK